MDQTLPVLNIDLAILASGRISEPTLVVCAKYRSRTRKLQ